MTIAEIEDRFPAVLGMLDVTGGEVVIGDCNVPPPGTRFGPIVRSQAIVRCAHSDIDDYTIISAMAIVFRHPHGSTTIERVSFSIDGVLLMIADGAYGQGLRWTQRRGLRSRVFSETNSLVQRGNTGPKAIQLISETNTPWAIVFKPGDDSDGIYDLLLFHDENGVYAAVSDFLESEEDDVE